jgi:hypothetical protein
MTTVTRVILITVAGPGGRADVGVRSDATPAALATALPSVIGSGVARMAAEHHGPSRPGAPEGRRVALSPHISLGESGVVDGDVVLFTAQDENARSQPARPGRAADPGTHYDAGHRPNHRRP